MKGRVVFKIDDVGLYFQFSIIEFEGISILFVCRDEKDNLYLCLSYEIRECFKWIITTVGINDLAALVNQGIDLYSIFVNGELKYKVDGDVGDGEQCYAVPRFHELDLPDQGLMLEYYDEETVRNKLFSLAINIEINRRSKMQRHSVQLREPYPIALNELDSFIQSDYRSEIKVGCPIVKTYNFSQPEFSDLVFKQEIEVLSDKKSEYNQISMNVNCSNVA